VDDLLRGLGSAVRKLRQEHGWTQEELAEAAELHMTYISDLERGARSPGLSTQQRLATALGVKVWELMKLAEENQRGLKEPEADCD
jgi:transcriptional regulator with XRE-family HTH domain